MGIKKIFKLSALLLALVGIQANAATISYYLDQSNALLDGVSYAQVTISDSTTTIGDIDFSVEVLASALLLADLTLACRISHLTMTLRYLSTHLISLILPL